MYLGMTQEGAQASVPADTVSSREQFCFHTPQPHSQLKGCLQYASCTPPAEAELRVGLQGAVQARLHALLLLLSPEELIHGASHLGIQAQVSQDLLGEVEGYLLLRATPKGHENGRLQTIHSMNRFLRRIEMSCLQKFWDFIQQDSNRTDGPVTERKPLSESVKAYILQVCL